MRCARMSASDASRGGDGGIREELATDMIIKSPLPGSEALLRKVQEALGRDRLPLLIAIDGADGIGKSSLASWLAWQLGAPAIYLDLYVIRGSNPLRWRSDELQSIIHTRLVEHASPALRAASRRRLDPRTIPVAPARARPRRRCCARSADRNRNGPA